jgi:hypothetical protein
MGTEDIKGWIEGTGGLDLQMCNHR